MNYNFKEKINDIKQNKTQNNINEINSRFIHNDNQKINLIPKQYKLKQMDNGKSNIIMELKIKPPLIIPDKHLEYINKNLIKIINIYQPEYNNEIKASGFGDFIRGTYFIIQFCEKYNLEVDIQINHPFNAFLKSQQINDLSNLNSNTYQQINSFDKTNFHIDGDNYNENEIIDDFCNYLKDQTYENKTALVYTISFNIVSITDEHRKCMRTFLEPINEFKIFILNQLTSMKLQLKGYIVIHIRSGDNILINNENFSINYLTLIMREIMQIYNPRNKYLLISDSIKLKKQIISLLPNIRSLFNEITHSGEGVLLNDNEKIKNTLLDFYLMAYSGKICAYSCYLHGTGFSKWCAETYNIPYKCKFIQEEMIINY